MDVFMIIRLFGGLAMFLYGMEIMGDGLKNLSGSALKSVLERATRNVLTGVITGMLVTAAIQSSTATIVLTVGLISAGILNLKQAVSIVMGANIGTTVTAQIIRLMDIDSKGNVLMEFMKPDTLAPIALVVGVVCIMFLKSPMSSTTGEIFAGFGVLFMGLLGMKTAVEPLAESDTFIQLMNAFASQPFLALLMGLVVTVIIQSSSAAVGMIQAISGSTGAMSFNLIAPMIMGINLGTCVTTAMVCSIGSSKDAKRTGIVHIVFNVIGTMVFMTGMYIARGAGLFPKLWDSVVDSGDIANFQTLFNLATAILLIPFAGLLVKLSLSIVKPDESDKEVRADLRAPDTKLYQVPAMALSESTKSIGHMGEVALRNLSRSCKQVLDFKSEKMSIIEDDEDNLDLFTDMIDDYLVELSKHIETDYDNRLINVLMQTSTNFERVGDHAVNIVEIAEGMSNGKIAFTSQAAEEYRVVSDAVNEITDITVKSFMNLDPEQAKRIEPLEEVIDDMVVILKDRHVERLKKGECNSTSGIAFVELLTNLERVADQCSNIALLILSVKDTSILGNHHGYVHELHKGGDANYNAELKLRKEEYLVRLNNIQDEEAEA